MLLSYKTVIFQQISLGSSTYTCSVDYSIPVPGLPIQFLVLYSKDMHSSMIAGDTEPWRVVVEVYTVNNIMSSYNKPSTQEKCTVKRIYTKHNIINIWVLSFCIYALLAASWHCWKHLWKPTPPPTPFLVQMLDLLMHSIQFLLWTQNNVLWANIQSTEQPHIARCRYSNYSEGRMVRILSLHKNCCTVRHVTRCTVMVKEPTDCPHSQPFSLKSIPKTFQNFAMKCEIHCLSYRNEHMVQHTPKLSKKWLIWDSAETFLTLDSFFFHGNL